jgi:hypothetical protein
MNRIDTLKTNTVLILAFLVAHLIFGAKWLLWTALLLALGNVFESRATTVIARYWMRFASFLGAVNTRILLAAMFFVVLTPIALLYRLFNREAADRFRKNSQSSYFDDVRKSFDREDFEKLW